MTTATHRDTDRFPWSWTLPPTAVTLLTAVVGIVRYPHLPARLPIHFDLGGIADRTTRTSVPAAFLPVFIQAVLTAGLIAAAVAVMRAPQPGRRLTAGAVLFLATCLDLGLFLLASQIWRRNGTLAGGTGVLALVLLLAGVAVVIAVAARASRRPHGETDPDHYRGIFYVNRGDRRLFVPKRFGVGWTLNFARPASWLFIGVIVLIVVAGAIRG